MIISLIEGNARLDNYSPELPLALAGAYRYKLHRWTSCVAPQPPISPLPQQRRAGLSLHQRALQPDSLSVQKHNSHENSNHFPRSCELILRRAATPSEPTAREYENTTPLAACLPFHSSHCDLLNNDFKTSSLTGMQAEQSFFISTNTT